MKTTIKISRNRELTYEYNILNIEYSPDGLEPMVVNYYYETQKISMIANDGVVYDDTFVFFYNVNDCIEKGSYFYLDFAKEEKENNPDIKYFLKVSKESSRAYIGLNEEDHNNILNAICEAKVKEAAANEGMANKIIDEKIKEIEKELEQVNETIDIANHEIKTSDRKRLMNDAERDEYVLYFKKINEGGDGFIPRMITQKMYDSALNKKEELELLLANLHSENAIHYASRYE